MTGKTIQTKKIAVVNMFIESMNKTLKKMKQTIGIEKGENLTTFLEAYFEKIRCDSGNLNQVLEGNRFVLNLFFEGIETNKEIKVVIEKLK